MLPLISYVAGGLVLFLYGVRLTSDGLREAAGGRLKAVLSVLTSRRSTGILAGVTVTFFLSSSSAVSVMLVELTNAGLLSLQQAILVILGSTIGTALFLQVIAFKISSYALIILIVGYGVNLAARYRRGKAMGTALIGLALVFLGLDLMGQGVGERAAEAVKSVTSWLDHRMLAFLIGMGLSVLVRSTATVGIAMVLAGSGVPLVNLVPVVLGAAVGTSSTTFIASATGSRKGKQVAVADFTIRLVIAAVFLPLVGPTADLVTWLTSHMGIEAGALGVARRGVANVHLFTSLTAAIVVMPFVSALAALAKKVVGQADRIPRGALQYISFEQELAPEDTLTRAHKEVVRMAGMTRELVQRAVRAVMDNDDRELERLEEDDEKVDVVDEVLSQYLARLNPSTLTADALEVKSKLLYIIKDLEAVADLATRELTRIGWEKSRDNVTFVDGEKQELAGLLGLVDGDLERLEQAVKGEDTSEALRAEVLGRDRDIDLQRMQLFDRQLARVSAGVPGAEDSTAAYMNTMNILRMIHFLICDIIRMISEPPPPHRTPGRSHDAFDAN